MLSHSRKQRVPHVKVAHKNSHNESEAMPQCSRLQQETINCKGNRKNVAKQTSKQKTQNGRKNKKEKRMLTLCCILITITVELFSRYCARIPTNTTGT